jgi:NAD(P)-dependent dehydrogenase (short-subunit alcohol dehydrogenase family)
LVVGGAGGLGSAICRRLIGAETPIFLTYRRNPAKAEALLAELRPHGPCHAARLDLTEPDSIAAAVASACELHGSIRAVVYAAGPSVRLPYVADVTAAMWRETLESDLFGFIHLMQAVIPQMKRQGGGTIVSITTFALEKFPLGDALSAVPKAGVEMLTRAIAREEGRNGIRANAVAPGIINAGLGDAFQKELFDPSVWERQRRKVPLGRFGEADEIADAVQFLVSDASRYITGQTLIVDGGLTI